MIITDKEEEEFVAKVLKNNTSKSITIPLEIAKLFNISVGDVIRLRFIKVVKKGRRRS